MGRRIFAVILGAGSGSRLSCEAPKQFSKLAGRSMIEHAFEKFDEHDAITDIIVVVPAKMTDEQDALVTRIQDQARKPTLVVNGGESRNQSTWKAIEMIADDGALVLIHDAARPLLQGDIISRCVDALLHYDAVDVVIECADTIVEVDEDDCIRSIPKRNALRRGQTPQGFKVGVLRTAYQQAADIGDMENSDDCGVVLKYLPHVTIKCVQGSESNLKITRPIDLVTADRLFQLRTSSYLDIAKRNPVLSDSIASKVVVVFGASSGIGLETAMMARAAGATVVGFSLSQANVDVRNEKDVDLALSHVQGQYGRIDVVVNSVGVLNRSALLEQDLAVVRETLDTNLFGAFVVARLAIPYLRATRGHLVLFTSSSYTRGRATYAAYSAAKAGLVNMVQALADEHARDGIKINCVNPERTATRMRARAFLGEDQSQMLRASEVARATLSLTDADITGQVIDVNVGSRTWESVADAAGVAGHASPAPDKQVQTI